MIKIFSAVFTAAVAGIAFAPSALAWQTQIVASGLSPLLFATPPKGTGKSPSDSGFLLIPPAQDPKLSSRNAGLKNTIS